MRRSAHTIPLLVVAALLVTLFYPALFLGYRVAPEASLKGEAPWRAQLGPYPNPSAVAVEAATHLGPRLATIAREGLHSALWDPWIGGGRPGWLASPAEGRVPLPLLVALTARHGWTWTALAALQVLLTFASAWLAIGALGFGRAWPAAIGATMYALSGPVAGHWLDWQGSALALGPLALVPAASRGSRPASRQVAAWGGVLLLLFASGAPAVPFVALAAAATFLARPLFGGRPAWSAPLAAAVLVAAVAVPSLWLQRAGVEAGAGLPAADPGPPIRRLADLLLRPPSPEAPEHTPPSAPAYLGAAAVLLALVGAVALKPAQRGFWLGALAVAGGAAFAPTTTLLSIGAGVRPLGVMALAVAVLVAGGADHLCRRVAVPVLSNTIGISLWLLIVLSLLPPAARLLPYATPEDAALPSPIAPAAGTPTSRMVAVLGMLPPDLAATLGLADVRAASFPGEPRYAALLGAGQGGELSVSRALARRTARLGARWVLEPLPLRVVSGELFARIDVVDLSLAGALSLDGLRRGPLDVPLGACRLGLPASSRPSAVWLEGPQLRSQLDPDPALVPESDAWRWFAVPAGWPPGAATLAVSGTISAEAARSLAWDTSGLRLVSEEGGTRVWEWDRARPLAFFAAGVVDEGRGIPGEDASVTVPVERLAALAPLAAGPGGRVRVDGLSPSVVDLAVETPAPALVVVQTKCRPALWRATVNGRKAATERVDGVWTGIVVPAGSSRVELHARLPLACWLAAGLGAGALGALAFPWRKR
jgi:hypothetical protein